MSATCRTMVASVSSINSPPRKSRLYPSGAAPPAKPPREAFSFLPPAHLVFHVRDNGPGISPDELESIFMPFQRGRGSAPAQPGTGLGLAICKRIVEHHGGRIWAENAVGGGAVLYLSLPLR